MRPEIDFEFVAFMEESGANGKAKLDRVSGKDERRQGAHSCHVRLDLGRLCANRVCLGEKYYMLERFSWRVEMKWVRFSRGDFEPGSNSASRPLTEMNFG